MFPSGATEGPSKTVMETLDTLFGLDQRPKPTVDGDFEAVNPPIKWHFSVPGPKHLLVGVDNRTRRSFVSREGPPGNVAVPALAEQIPETLPAGRELLIVVCATAGDRTGAARRADRPRRLSRIRRGDLQRHQREPRRSGGRSQGASQGDRHAAHGRAPIRTRSKPGYSIRTSSKRCLRASRNIAACCCSPATCTTPPSTSVELLDEGQRRSGAHRPVHRQRLQERDAVVHRRRRSRAVVRAAHGAKRSRRGTHGLEQGDEGGIRPDRRAQRSPTCRRSCDASCTSRRC